MWNDLRSTDGHTCSPIREISTCRPHDEHLIVGRKADSLSPDMVAIQHFRVVVQNVLFEGEGKHWRCRHRHVLQKQSLSGVIGTRWRAASLWDIKDERARAKGWHTTPPVSATSFKMFCADPSGRGYRVAETQPRRLKPATACSSTSYWRESIVF